MLKPLHPTYMRDANGDPVTDEEGRQERNPRAGQPLADKELNAVERRGRANEQSQEEELKIVRYRNKIERDAVLKAALKDGEAAK